jgi:hypothetical protein
MTIIAAVTGAILTAGIGLPQPAAAAAEHDGPWTVLIITEKGTCDQAYRYNLKISGGRIAYDGDTSAKVNGTVAANGAVRVNISLGEKSANGTGRLAGRSGSGRWQSAGNDSCGGRWEAERR